jgi:hypothetical protein
MKTFVIAWPLFRQMLPVETNAVYYLERDEDIALLIPKNGILLQCLYAKQGGIADDIFRMEYLGRATRIEAILDDVSPPLIDEPLHETNVLLEDPSEEVQDLAEEDGYREHDSPEESNDVAEETRPA